MVDSAPSNPWTGPPPHPPAYSTLRTGAKTLASSFDFITEVARLVAAVEVRKIATPWTFSAADTGGSVADAVSTT